MYRTSEYRRDVRARHIARKKRICNNIMSSDWYPHDGQYSKGKIHCSCRMCTYSKFYDLPTEKDEKEKEYVRSCLEDYYEEENEKAHKPKTRD